MAYWRHKATGVVVKLKDNQVMIDTWVKVEEISETEFVDDNKQVFSSVKALKKEADTSKNAFTERGAEYSFTDGKWDKVG